MKVIKKMKLATIIGFLLLSISIGVFLYHANKPIFSYNYIEDDFEDQIVGLFPMGWLSAINPFNMRVISDGGNKVMEVKSISSQEYGTEITKRFKKTSEGVIEVDVKPLDITTGFVIHVPQLDREYDPFDDIMIMFSNGEIYVIQGENIVEVSGQGGLFWYMFLLVNKDRTWGISVPEDSVMEYKANIWYSIKIDFTKENFLLSINGNLLGTFNYPKYNPPYFASLYFYPLRTSYNFRFYVDNVKITIIQSVDYIHPANIILLVIVPISAIGFYMLYKRRRR